MEVFLETSAILAWLFNEKKAKQVVNIVSDASSVVVSKLAVIETRRALSRALAEKILTEADYRKLSLVFSDALQAWVQLEIVSEIQERSAKTFPVEPVRTLDAIHLASALFCLEAFPNLKVVSLDKRVVENAKGLGLEVAIY